MLDLIIVNSRKIFPDKEEYISVNDISVHEMVALCSLSERENLPFYMGMRIYSEYSSSEGSKNRSNNQEKVYIEIPFYFQCLFKACFEIEKQQTGESVSFLFGEYPPSSIIRDEDLIIIQLPVFEADTINERILFEEDAASFMSGIKKTVENWQSLLASSYDVADKKTKKYMREKLLIDQWRFE